MIVPDYRYFQHSTELYHYGIKRRSGRYPWGSGERPYQSMGERMRIRRDEKNLKVGKERLENRIERANALADVDRLSRKIGWHNTEEAGKAHRSIKDIKQITNEILSDEERTRDLGQYTRSARLLNTVVTATSVAGVSGLSAAALISAWGVSVPTLGIPVILGAGIANMGYQYYKRTKY